jgi:hypothetical protein
MPNVCPDAPVDILIYYREHEAPHFHVCYPAGSRNPEYNAQVTIEDRPRVKSGKIPRRYKAEALGWAARESAALATAWNQAQESRPHLDQIPWKA